MQLRPTPLKTEEIEEKKNQLREKYYETYSDLWGECVNFCGEHYISLDGLFTSKQLRFLASAMDVLQEEIEDLDKRLDKSLEDGAKCA